MKRLRLTPEAELDLDDAYGWYQAHRPRLAADFLAAVQTSIASIHRHPEAYQLVRPDDAQSAPSALSVRGVV